MSPLISVIIVNYNGKKWLQKCLDSLFIQSYQNIEVIIVDNASSDDSVQYIKTHYSQIVLIKAEKNGGFAYGNNLGIKQAKGEYILMLNNDTWLEADFLESLYDRIIETSADVIAPQEGLYDGKKVNPVQWTIDTFGHCVKLTFEENKKPFYLSGVCLLFLKKLYQETGGLDEDFFMYFEETDWFWRLNLYEKKIVQLEDIWIYHAGAGSTSGGGLQYNNFLWRNQNTLQMLLKNYSWYNLIWTLPIYILQNIGEMIVFLIILKPKIAYSYIEGWIFNIKNLSKIQEKRKLAQSTRLIQDIEIFPRMYKGFGKMKHLIQFIGK